MKRLLQYRMTEGLRYRSMLVLARLGVCCGVLSSLIWSYVLYYREQPGDDFKVTALLIFVLALTAMSLFMTRFAAKRLKG